MTIADRSAAPYGLRAGTRGEGGAGMTTMQRAGCPIQHLSESGLMIDVPVRALTEGDLWIVSALLMAFDNWEEGGADRPFWLELEDTLERKDVELPPYRKDKGGTRSSLV
jgi:hypothetical protein